MGGSLGFSGAKPQNSNDSVGQRSNVSVGAFLRLCILNFVAEGQYWVQAVARNHTDDLSAGKAWNHARVRFLVMTSRPNRYHN